MTAADALTWGRIGLSPLFFLAFSLAYRLPSASPVAAAAALGIFALIEISDLLDGILARRLGEPTDTGRLLDPFADSVSRLTYFICFTVVGLMPPWVLLLVVYRDVAVAFVRILAVRRGVVVSARLSGKIKAWVYAVAGIAGMALVCGRTALIPAWDSAILESIAAVAFVCCAVIAVGSLIDYLTPLVRQS